MEERCAMIKENDEVRLSIGLYHLIGVVEEVDGRDLIVRLKEQRIITHPSRVIETIKKGANDDRDKG
jgi:hypothetical protein